ncbi:unnamed protein product [Polarella glacialis]|uniref:Uncharacterized protein n=1 Tax=Polarella glacialis TaxID=89957 RepID=A0A813D4L9_POLGL|nr:unnamed protein product [Polarella glacialis]
MRRLHALRLVRAESACLQWRSHAAAASSAVSSNSASSQVRAEHELRSVRTACIYQSSVNFEKLVDASSQKCLFGCALGVAGFANAVAALLPVAPTPVVALLVAGMVSYPGISMWMTPVWLRKLAAPQVEEIWILGPEGMKAGNLSGTPPVKAPPGGAEADAQLKASCSLLTTIPEMELEIVSVSLSRRVVLQEPEKLHTFLRAAGCVADSRARFCDLCALPSWDGGSARIVRRGPLHVDPAEGAEDAADWALLEALLRSRKVLAEESVRRRAEVASSLRLPETSDLAGHRLGALDVQTATTAGQAERPAQAIASFGIRALLGGSLLFAAGSACLASPDQLRGLFAGQSDEEGAELYYGPHYGR